MEEVGLWKVRQQIRDIKDRKGESGGKTLLSVVVPAAKHGGDGQLLRYQKLLNENKVIFAKSKYFVSPDDRNVKKGTPPHTPHNTSQSTVQLSYRRRVY